MAHGKKCGCTVCKASRGYVVVHRNSAGDVMQAGEPFTDESDANPRAVALLQSINFFAGDSLHVEPNNGQAREARNT